MFSCREGECLLPYKRPGAQIVFRKLFVHHLFQHTNSCRTYAGETEAGAVDGKRRLFRCNENVFFRSLPPGTVTCYDNNAECPFHIQVECSSFVISRYGRHQNSHTGRKPFPGGNFKVKLPGKGFHTRQGRKRLL